MGHWEDERELIRALTMKDIRVVPVLLPGVGDLPLELDSVEPVDFRDGISGFQLDRLVTSLRRGGQRSA